MNKKGFTLIELLIVVTIIGILAVALVPRIVGGSASARDARRQTDLQSIATGLEYYLSENGTFDDIGTVNTPVCAATLSSTLQTFIGSIPSDPDDDNTNVAFGASCAGDYVVLFMEPTDGSTSLTKYAIAANLEVAESGDDFVYDTPAVEDHHDELSMDEFTGDAAEDDYFVVY